MFKKVIITHLLSQSVICIIALVYLCSLSAVIKCQATSTSDISSPKLFVPATEVTPTIDGTIDLEEWKEAACLLLDSTRMIYTMHDRYNLYLATYDENDTIKDNGCNIYMRTADKIRVIHASYSVGIAMYTFNEEFELWACSEPYNFSLYGLDRMPKDRCQQMIKEYLQNNGWVGSTIRMGKVSQTEFAISFNWLGINPLIKNLTELQKLRISNVAIAHKGIIWPNEVTLNKSVNGGRSLEIIKLNQDGWGTLIIESP